MPRARRAQGLQQRDGASLREGRIVETRRAAPVGGGRYRRGKERQRRFVGIGHCAPRDEPPPKLLNGLVRPSAPPERASAFGEELEGDEYRCSWVPGRPLSSSAMGAAKAGDTEGKHDQQERGERGRGRTGIPSTSRRRLTIQMGRPAVIAVVQASRSTSASMSAHASVWAWPSPSSSNHIPTIPCSPLRIPGRQAHRTSPMGRGTRRRAWGRTRASRIRGTAPRPTCAGPRPSRSTCLPILRPLRETQRDARGDADLAEHHRHQTGELLAEPAMRPREDVRQHTGIAWIGDRLVVDERGAPKMLLDRDDLVERGGLAGGPGPCDVGHRRRNARWQRHQ